MPDQDPVVWPDDPVEADAAAAEADTAKTAEPSWPSTFDDALKQSQAASEQAAAPAPVPAAIAEPAAAAPVHEYPTQPSMPAITAAKTEPPAPAEPAKTVPPEPAKTVPPEPAKTVPPEPARNEEPAPVLGTADELPTSTFKTPIPAPAEVSAANGAEAPAAEPVAEAAPEPEPEGEATPEPAPEPVQTAAPEPEPEPAKAPEAEPDPEPVQEPEPAPEPAKAAEPEPAKPAEPQPEPAAKEEEWVPLPENPPVPAWAPKLGAPAAAAAEQQVDWGASNPLPAWAPIGGGRSTANMPAATRISSTPEPAAAQPPKPAAPAPASSSQPPAAAARASQPPAADASKPKTSSWEIVPPKVDQPKQAYVGPSAEDKSYAEWFAWAKRSGAPAGACHAAAQGAFRALSAGHDMNTAVQWATAAMGSPPGLVSASRQLYCAWYSLGNIDLKLPSPQAHAFAAGAIAALDSGADAPTAHQAGLAAAGIIG